MALAEAHDSSIADDRRRAIARDLDKLTIADPAVNRSEKVQTNPAGPRAAARFIVCDKRSDINRAALTTAHVDQRKCDAEALARFVVAQLGLRTHGDVTLVVADTAVALADLIDFERGAYVLDTAAIRHLVDAATTADPHYTPSTTRREAHTRDTQARYARWQRPTAR